MPRVPAPKDPDCPVGRDLEAVAAEAWVAAQRTTSLWPRVPSRAAEADELVLAQEIDAIVVPRDDVGVSPKDEVVHPVVEDMEHARLDLLDGQLDAGQDVGAD